MMRAMSDDTGPVTCDECGCASEWRAAFTRNLCPECAVRNASRQERWVLFAIVVVAMGCGFAVSRGATSAAFLLAIAWLMFVASQPLLVVLHELGHVIAARLVKVRVYAIAIGREPWWFDRDIAGVRLRIGGFMLGGAVCHEPSEGPRSRLRSIFITAGGPLMNLLVAGIAFAWAAALPSSLDQSLVRFALLIVGAASAAQGIANLWPRPVQVMGRQTPNDGARIMALLSGQADDPNKQRGGGHYLRAQFAFYDRRFDVARLEVAQALELLIDAMPRDACTVLWAAIACETGDARGAVAALRPLHGDATKEPAVRVGIANNLAWGLFLLDEPDGFEEGLSAIADARRIAPWERACLSTQACLMAASATTGNGRATEALQLIGKFRSPPRNASEAAALCVARGLVAAFQGEVSAARAEYERARALVVDSPILRLLERRLASP